MGGFVPALAIVLGNRLDIVIPPGGYE